METTIPFQGFYNSMHDNLLDHELDSICSDSSGCHIYDTIRDKMFDCIDWQAAHLEYSKKYVEVFKYEFGLGTLKFKLLSSPKYYNYETDRIICDIELSEVKSLLERVDLDIFDSLIKRRFTSCDGFCSFYPNDRAKWPEDLEEWDHNHVGTLLEAFILTQDSKDFEYKLLDSLYEPAMNCIYNNTKGAERYYKILDYLRTREERKWRVAA